MSQIILKQVGKWFRKKIPGDFTFVMFSVCHFVPDTNRVAMQVSYFNSRANSLNAILALNVSPDYL